MRHTRCALVTGVQTCALPICGGALTVGSVEFVREAMRLADIIEPEVMTYPDALLTNWAFRAISLVAKGNVPAAGAWFIKPAGEIGRAHVCTPVTNAHLVCRLLLEKQN